MVFPYPTAVEALHTARIKEVAVIEALAKIGQLVKNKAQTLGKLRSWPGDIDTIYIIQHPLPNPKRYDF